MIRLFSTGMILLLLLYARPSMAQGENNTWCFGRKTGLDFSTSPPTFFQHSMDIAEGSAAISDAGGNLLFYSSGANNWDRNGNLMPNGTGLHGNGPILPSGLNAGSSKQGVAIVPSPSNANQYYMITTEANEDDSARAYYSVIDMSLNGGMGDVVSGQRDILFASDVAEGVIVQSTDQCGSYWIILYGLSNPAFLSFKIDAAGINPVPVVSPGTPSNYGHLIFNLQGTLLARSRSTVELLSFSKSTGAFSLIGQLTVQGTTSYNAFSPDGNKLYAAGGPGIFQFDLSLLPSIAAVQSSRIHIDPGVVSQVRNGPDGKIYALRSFVHKIGIIDNPNASGAACAYNATAMQIPPSGTLSFVCSELGSSIVVNPPADTIGRLALDTQVCQLPQLRVKASPADNYRWSTGSTAQEEVFTQDGAYWVASRSGCTLQVDTFRIRFIRFDPSLGPDTAICKGYELRPNPGIPGATYLWQDGSTGSSLIINEKGTYSVTTSLEGCTASDTIVIDMATPSFRLYPRDTLICDGTPLQLHAELYPQGSYLWSNGSTGPVTTVDQAGTYAVAATNACDTFSDSIQVTTQYCNCTAYAPNAFSPNGDGRNDLFVIELHCPSVTAYSHTIYNRYGQKVFESKQPGEFWNGMFNGNPCDAGTYFYYLEYKNGTEKIKKKGDLVVVR